MERNVLCTGALNNYKEVSHLLKATKIESSVDFLDIDFDSIECIKAYLLELEGKSYELIAGTSMVWERSKIRKTCYIYAKSGCVLDIFLIFNYDTYEVIDFNVMFYNAKTGATI